MPVIYIITLKLINLLFEDISVPENDEEMKEMGYRVYPRKINPGPVFYPPTDAIDIPPVVLGHNTGALCSDWTPTEEGYDIEEVEDHHKHAFRLIYKIRNHRELLRDLFEKKFMDDDPDLIVVSYGTPSRVVNTAVEKSRASGLKVGSLRLINLWPFPDELFTRNAKYLVVELNWDGQLVREVQRAAPKDAQVHFLGICGELPSQPDLTATFEKILIGRPLARQGWKLEAW